MKTITASIGAVALLALSSAPSWADTVDFDLSGIQSGQPAKASDVTDAFNAVKSAVDANDAAITTNSNAINTKANATDLSTLEGQVSANKDAIGNASSGLTKAVSDNTAALSLKANTSDLSNLDARVSDNEAAIGDASSGLTQQVDTNTADIAANNTAIQSKADASDLTTLEGRVTANEDAITTPVTGLEDRVSALEAGATADCPGNDTDDVMVKVGPLCVDKYEASVWDALTGGSQILDVQAVCNQNGSDCKGLIFARSKAGVTPAVNVTWFQAQQACANAGKRLLTNAEWQMAAAGTNTAVGCNVGTASLALTGSGNNCLSAWLASDMVGNASEWVADWLQGKGVSDASASGLTATGSLTVDTNATVDTTGGAGPVTLTPSNSSATNPITGTTSGSLSVGSVTTTNTDNGGAGSNFDDDQMFEVQKAGKQVGDAQTSNADNFPAAVYRGGSYQESAAAAGEFAFSTRRSPAVYDNFLGFRCAR